MDAVLELRLSPNSAWKVGQEPISGALDDAAPVPGNRRQDRVRHQCGQTCVRRFFVIVHETRIAGEIRHQYRGQPPFDALVRHEAPGIRKGHLSISILSQGSFSLTRFSGIASPRSLT
jgi:hypothetical protein